MESTITTLANSRQNIQKRVDTGAVSLTWPVLMLFSRLVLFALCQTVIAVTLSLLGWQNAWDESAAWWPIGATLTNLLGMLLLFHVTKREGMQIIDLYRVEKHHIGRELLIVLGLLVIAAPIMYFPNVLVATWLYGDMNQVTALFFRPLPLWVLIPTLILFPVTIALVELPTYYSYVMPRLAALVGKHWPAILVVALFHAAQHGTLPLICDWRFLTWRLLMFVPFALLAAICIDRRSRLLPYLMVVHGLLDLQLVVMLLPLAT
jgi:hypothetical protein